MEDLISDFLAETKEGLDNLDNQLVTLEQNPNDKDLLSSIFRIMHTIKGTCGFLALSRLESVAHAGENIMDKVRSNQLAVSGNIVSLILECVDKIKEIIAAIEATGSEPEGNDEELIKKLNMAAKGANPDTASETTTTLADLEASFTNHHLPPTLQSDLTQAVEPSAEATSIKPIEPVQPVKPVKPIPTTNAAENSSKKPAEATTAAGKTDSGTIRVSVDVLENLMQIVGELVLNRNQLLQLDRGNINNQFSNPIQTLSHITSQLQEGIMKTRMQPISSAWAKLPRMIRDLSHELNKKINLKMIGEETELDRQLIESIKDPLIHMIRNSADHGLEMPDERVKKGKNDIGTITLKAFHQGGHIIIEISDDGRGINIARVKDKILSSKLATEEQVAQMTESQIIQYIFRAGFSTAEAVTSVSGRGVGMDVVKNNINKINGSVDLKSVAEKGATFIIKIPLTLAIMPVLIVEAGGENLAIPQINVLEICKAGENEDNKIEKVNESQLLRIRNTLLPIVDLSKLFAVTKKDNSSNKTPYVVICEISGNNFGIIVDKVFDSEEIVVKPIVEPLMKIGLYSGNTILGNGKVIMILDPVGLFKTICLTEGYKENNDDDTAKINKESENTTTFLVVKTDSKTYKAIPLEIVSRLEEINVDSIETSNGHEVIQYRGTLMPLVKNSDALIYPESGVLQLIVFSNKDSILGLIVEEIVDAVTIEINNDSNFFSYEAVVIQGKTMDIIDVGDLFQLIHPEKEVTHDVIVKEDHKTSNEIIIYVDDSIFFRKLVPPSLKHLEKEVVTFDSALNAIEFMQKNTTQLIKAIITDINMPKMSGIEFADFCKNHSEFNNIPIIALTSTNEEDKMQAALDHGILYCVAKTNHHDIVKYLSEIVN
jgi:two-component system chemotaxis sensor kinase CheA